MSDPRDQRTEEAEIIREQETRVERVMTAREIFMVGFKRGQSLAGVRSDASKEFDYYLLERSCR